MTIAEMWNDLGFDRMSVCDKGNVLKKYIKKQNNMEVVCEFYKNKTYTVRGFLCDPCSYSGFTVAPIIGMRLNGVINKQIEELGW